MGKWWKLRDFTFLGSKITADGDCSHEIRRLLLLRRKVMINLDSIFKSRDITLPTKVCLVKAIVFPVVMYGCESWIKLSIKELMLLNYDVGEDSESPLDRKEIKPVNPKGDQSWIFTGSPDAEAETPILWPPDVRNWLIGKDPDAEKDWRQEEKGMTEDEMVGWHHQLRGHEFEQAPGVDGQGSLVSCTAQGHKASNMTEQLKWQTWLIHGKSRFNLNSSESRFLATIQYWMDGWNCWYQQRTESPWAAMHFTVWLILSRIGHPIVLHDCTPFIFYSMFPKLQLFVRAFILLRFLNICPTCNIRSSMTVLVTVTITKHNAWHESGFSVSTCEMNECGLPSH